MPPTIASFLIVKFENSHDIGQPNQKVLLQK